MNEIVLSIAKDFSTTPGVRYPSEGEFSGEEFRDKILIPAIEKARRVKCKLLIDLDGTSGLGPSFLEEAFGGLIRKGYSLKELLNLLVFKSDEIPYYIEDITNYMRDASSEK